MLDLGLAYDAVGQGDDARSSLNRALEIDPDLEEAHFALELLDDE